MTDKPVTVSERELAREREIANRYFPDEDGDKIAYTISHESERRKCIKAMVAYRRESVREALLQYGQHGASCTATLGQGKPCDCGFTAELEEADQ